LRGQYFQAPAPPSTGTIAPVTIDAVAGIITAEKIESA
jgi:hypothetical protein